ncbi:N-acyl homoserine lactonase family protein [Verticiella sediminum]|uniref:N-acyl homoserine lactonase family protein n=1 Tax=Verticiella sediminum TaxID=1247510 RepID=A0A556AFC0_9BURK|nr:N-acyl homoserine lactonase family protein [Verticiella sediminum]TSH91570.1 N-acyl homoserine lactonase family protein [Verticiella sediminum]
MPDSPDIYRVYAIKYAHHERRSTANFIGGDSHDVPMPLDYFVWAIVGEHRSFLVDTGFDQSEADKRGRVITRPIQEGLAAIGIATERLQDVILTHMHYDHAGNRELFPRARYHVQDREMSFCTGRCMCHRPLNVHFAVDDVTSMVHKVFDGRVEFHDGDAELASGVSVHLVGGHTAGLQVVRVHTARGWLVLASDASHFYANIEQQRPFPAVYNVGDMLEGYALIRRLADSPELIVPGHDPLVLERFSAEKPEHAGWIVRLDAPVRQQ